MRGDAMTSAYPTTERPHRRSVLTFLAGLCLAVAALCLPPAAHAELNQRLQIRLMLPPSVPPDHGVKQRLMEGKNLQAMIIVPQGQDVGGPLLDPASVSVTWNGKRQQHHLVYKAPSLALLFARVDDQVLAEQNELSVTARLIGSDPKAEVDAGWVLPITFSPAEIERIQQAPEPQGRTVLIQAPSRKPIPGAYLLGQRREDVWALANDAGTVTLTAPTRNTMEIHYAGAPGYWTTPFDPVVSRTITLQPIPLKAKPEKVRLDLRDADGERIRNALLLVNEREYVPLLKGKTPRALLKKDGTDEVVVVAAGYRPLIVKLENPRKTVKATLERFRPTAPSKPAGQRK